MIQNMLQYVHLHRLQSVCHTHTGNSSPELRSQGRRRTLEKDVWFVTRMVSISFKTSSLHPRTKSFHQQNGSNDVVWSGSV